MENALSIAESLLHDRHRHDHVPPAAIGVYAFYVDMEDSAQLLPVMTEAPGLLYVGMSEQGQDVRNHFTQRSSGFSVFRRSLGAVLKTRLKLEAVPRGAGSSINNTRNYGFTPEGEERLSAWMREHLSFSYYVPDADISLLENDVIRAMKPSLSLNGWDNPQARMIRLMRKVCVDEALKRLDAAA